MVTEEQKKFLKEKKELLGKISGATIIELEGNELTEYKGYEIYRNGDGMYTVFTVWANDRQEKLTRYQRDDVHAWIVDKVLILGYTLSHVSFMDG